MAACGFAQDPQTTGSPAGLNSTTRMDNETVANAMTAARSGKKVTLTVDNRTVAFSPRLIGNMLYVPVRFFGETGLKVTWDRGDKRATVRDENGPAKNSIEYDASVPQKTLQPGPSMRPVYQKGTLYVPLATGLAAFGLLAEWVPNSNRINVRSGRPVPSP